MCAEQWLSSSRTMAVKPGAESWPKRYLVWEITVAPARLAERAMASSIDWSSRQTLRGTPRQSMSRCRPLCIPTTINETLELPEPGWRPAVLLKANRHLILVLSPEMSTMAMGPGRFTVNRRGKGLLCWRYEIPSTQSLYLSFSPLLPVRSLRFGKGGEPVQCPVYHFR